MNTPRIDDLLAEAVRHHHAGDLPGAEHFYRQVLDRAPRHAGGLNMLGLIAYQTGRPHAAVELLSAAQEADPRDGSVPMHLGLALRALGRLDEAVAACRRAVALRPANPQGHNNLANMLRDLGALDDAAASYRTALSLDPGQTITLNNFSALLLAQGDFAGAMTLAIQSLQVRETPQSRRLFCELVGRLSWTARDRDLEAVMVRALTEPWARPGKLARAAAHLVRLDPALGGAIARADAAWPQYLDAAALYGTDGLDAANASALLQALLVSAQNVDIGLERFLTMARRLAAAHAQQAPDFHAALARQCFINEYVFFQDEAETRQATARQNELAALLAAGEMPDAALVLAVACYAPLVSIPDAQALLAAWPAPVAAVLTQQLREPKEEARLRNAMPALTGFHDTSHPVQAMYEANPYPRWVRAAPPGARGGLVADMRERFPRTWRGGEGEAEDFLVAGCGTGRQCIELAQRYAGRFLAVDLSLSSLGYAARKTGELGVADMDYARADILELPGATTRRFDMIEASGVLHHLDDPLAGWRALLSLLKPGGVMLLGFYSRTARRGVTRARAFIAAEGFDATPDGIRRCRQALMRMPDEYEAILESEDFFGVSACRDLLFHVREHQMTLPQIGEFLRGNGLRLLGFETDPTVLEAYRMRFPADPAAAELESWRALEDDHPGIFAGMYRFWVQKDQPVLK